jgi:ferritin-like metal-binding protein YciE
LAASTWIDAGIAGSIVSPTTCNRSAILDQEKAADHKLTNLAVSTINKA